MSQCLQPKTNSTEFDVRWNTCLQLNPQADFFHSLEWQKIVRKVYNATPLFSLLQDESGYAAMTAFETRSLLSGRKITSMPFNYYPSPLYSSEEKLKEILLNIKNTALSQGIETVEIKSIEPLPESVISETGLIETKPFINSILYLPKDYSTFLSGLSKNMRQNLRTTRNHAKDAGVTLQIVETESELSEFYKLLLMTYRDQHRMVCQPYELYLQLFQNSGAGYKFQVRLAMVENEIAGAIVVIYGRHRVYYSWAANHTKYRSLGLNYWLLDTLIEELTTAGEWDSLDFGTTPASDEKLLFFKDRWKCVSAPVYYYYFFKAHSQLDMNSSFQLARYFYSKVPLWMLHQLMPYIVPQLA